MFNPLQARNDTLHLSIYILNHSFFKKVFLQKTLFTVVNLCSSMLRVLFSVSAALGRFCPYVLAAKMFDTLPENIIQPRFAYSLRFIFSKRGCAAFDNLGVVFE
jgi:hypothetical protein